MVYSTIQTLAPSLQNSGMAPFSPNHGSILVKLQKRTLGFYLYDKQVQERQYDMHGSMQVRQVCAREGGTRAREVILIVGI